jgi:hypothetical protein
LIFVSFYIFCNKKIVKQSTDIARSVYQIGRKISREMFVNSLFVCFLVHSSVFMKLRNLVHTSRKSIHSSPKSVPSSWCSNWGIHIVFELHNITRTFGAQIQPLFDISQTFHVNTFFSLVKRPLRKKGLHWYTVGYTHLSQAEFHFARTHILYGR